jgi:AcrR family transcriptional regulator
LILATIYAQPRQPLPGLFAVFQAYGAGGNRARCIAADRVDTGAGMPRLKAAQRREQLLTVATRVFAKYGYDATTTAAIAQAAGVTEPILYRHFGSKQELFVAITQDVSQRTLCSWRELSASIDDPAERLRAIARQFPDHLKEISDAYRVIHNAITTSRDRKVMAVLREHYRQMEAFFSEIIKTGQERGQFRQIDLATPSWHLINTGIGYAMMTLNLTPFQTFDVEEAIGFLLRSLEV